jgi:ABC-type branched-subunit amino acid transport system substrate-binding protein
MGGTEMLTGRMRTRSVVGAVLVVGLIAGTFVVTASNRGHAAARGFDGTTITVGGLGLASNFLPGASNGAQARIKAFNDNNEIKGIKIKYDGFADDAQSPATALSEVRRLVTQDSVFAIVPALSQYVPGDFITQQKVPVFGWGFSPAYCSPKPTTSGWAYGWSGCQNNPEAPVVPDGGKTSYAYVSKKTGKQHPTITLVSNDSEGGKQGVELAKIYLAGAGFEVTGTNNQMPATAVADYTPYAQAAMKGSDGKAPDAILCILSTDCLGLYDKISASGYQGTFMSPLYSDILVKALNGSAVSTLFVPFSQQTAGVEQLKQALDAYQPGLSAKVDTPTFAAYASMDMFIQALKVAAKGGVSKITPEAVQKAASTMTWKIDGLAGPVIYPKASQVSYPWCSAISVSDGTKWTQVEAFSCSKKQFKK